MVNTKDVPLELEGRVIVAINDRPMRDWEKVTAKLKVLCSWDTVSCARIDRSL